MSPFDALSSNPYHLVHLSGEYDIALRGRLVEKLDIDPTKHPFVIVDLSDVIYLDSIAIGLLIACRMRVADAGGHFALVATRSHVKRLLHMVGLDQSVPLYESIEDAETHLRTMQSNATS